MGLMQREKGKRWEREVAIMFREIFGDDCVHRTRQSRGVSDGPDVVVDGYFWLECKHSEASTVATALKQALRDIEQCPREEYQRLFPIAVVKHNRKKPVAGMHRSDVQRLQELLGASERNLGFVIPARTRQPEFLEAPLDLFLELLRRHSSVLGAARFGRVPSPA